MATRSTKPSAMTTSYAMQSILTDVVSAGTEAPLGYGLGYVFFTTIALPMQFWIRSNASSCFLGTVSHPRKKLSRMAATLCLCRPAQGHSGGYACPTARFVHALRKRPALCSKRRLWRTPIRIKGEALSGASLFLVCFLLSAWLYRGKRIFCRRFPQAAVLNMRIDHCGIDAGMA